MNRAKLGAFQRQALAPKSSQIEGAFSAVTSNGGTRFALPEVKTQVLYATLIAGDPNHNGGLDANGFQQAFIITYDFGFTDKTNWPEVRIDVSSLPDKLPNFDDGTYVYAFHFGFTSDGYLLLKPTIFSPGPGILFGHVTTTIPAIGGGHGVVRLYDRAGNNLGIDVDCYPITAYPFGVGTVTDIVWDVNQKKWYPLDYQQVEIGFVNDSSGHINGGSAGTVQVTDDQNNNLFSISACRALVTVAKNQKVIISFDFTKAEYFCWPLSNSVLFGKVTTQIPAFGGGAGVVELYDSARNDLSVSVSAVTLTAYPYGVGTETTLFYDAAQSKWVALDYQQVEYGFVNDTGGSIVKGTTGVVQVTDDQNNNLFSISACRALATIPRYQKVLITFDYTKAEYFCWPLTTQPALDIDFHLTGTLAHGDATASAAIDSYNNGFQPAGAITVNNSMHWSLPNGGHGWATLTAYDWNAGTATYEIRSVRMVDWSGYNAANLQFLAHDTSGNTEWLDSAACP